MTMADWSQLPEELLSLIAKRLETRFDVLRFRSVCSSWCSSFPPKLIHPMPSPQNLPSETKRKFPFDLWDWGITTNTFYLVRLPEANKTAAACWVVNVREYTHHRLKM
ncbi:hypothetical protein PTKIN_Ptkin02bG0219200 [Pterospermum kingtungense]